MTLSDHNRVQLIWVSRHKRIAGNETADLLTNQGAETLFIGPESACSSPGGAVRRVLRDLSSRKHLEH